MASGMGHLCAAIKGWPGEMPAPVAALLSTPPGGYEEIFQAMSSHFKEVSCQAVREARQMLQISVDCRTELLDKIAQVRTLFLEAVHFGTNATGAALAVPLNTLIWQEHWHVMESVHNTYEVDKAPLTEKGRLACYFSFLHPGQRKKDEHFEKMILHLPTEHFINLMQVMGGTSLSQRYAFICELYRLASVGGKCKVDEGCLVELLDAVRDLPCSIRTMFLSILRESVEKTGAITDWQCILKPLTAVNPAYRVYVLSILFSLQTVPLNQFERYIRMIVSSVAALTVDERVNIISWFDRLILKSRVELHYLTLEKNLCMLAMHSDTDRLELMNYLEKIQAAVGDIDITLQSLETLAARQDRRAKARKIIEAPSLAPELHLTGSGMDAMIAGVASLTIDK